MLCWACPARWYRGSLQRIKYPGRYVSYSGAASPEQPSNPTVGSNNVFVLAPRRKALLAYISVCVISVFVHVQHNRLHPCSQYIDNCRSGFMRFEVMISWLVFSRSGQLGGLPHLGSPLIDYL